MSVLFPKRISIDNASVQELQQLFTDSTSDLQGYLFTLDGQTVSRGNIATIRSLIAQRLQKLGVAVGSWISANVPQQYIDAQVNVAKQQDSFGNDVAAATIIGIIAHVSSRANLPTPDIVTDAPKVITPPQDVLDLQTQSVQSVMDSMSQSFGASMSTMGRTADNTISDVQRLDIRRQIAQKANEGADTNKISKQISDTIRNSGISGLVDAGGKQWTPEGYASMLVNTKLAEASRNGKINALTASGGDLVEVSSHGATDSCADWEGEILSVSGNNPNFQSLDDAYNSGGHIFGPNCEHDINTVDESSYPSADDSNSDDSMDDE